MATQYKTCPECKEASTVEFWDTHTKQEEGIKNDKTFLSSGASKEEHDEQQSYFRCPICNEEVDGSALK